MRRLAAHYIYISPKIILKRHCVELDDDSRIVSIFPLEAEVENTIFYNGILFFTNKGNDINPGFYSKEALPVDVFLLEGIDLSSPEFSTNNSSGNGPIQRL